MPRLRVLRVRRSGMVYATAKATLSAPRPWGLERRRHRAPPSARLQSTHMDAPHPASHSLSMRLRGCILKHNERRLGLFFQLALTPPLEGSKAWRRRQQAAAHFSLCAASICCCAACAACKASLHCISPACESAPRLAVSAPPRARRGSPPEKSLRTDHTVMTSKGPLKKSADT